MRSCVRTASSMVDRPVKRYIAGAVCPACGAVDKIYLLQDDDGLSRHCNKCGFQERSGSDADWQPVRIDKRHE